VGAELLRRAQADGFTTLVIDGAYRKSGTHNDNTLLASALRLTGEQREALNEYNHLQQRIEQVLCRFDSRSSQMTPWSSDWAGGTEGSDLRIAKEYGLDPRLINGAKEVASEVFPLERAVTPFSEYKLRLGIAIMIEPGIEPKSADAVRAWVNGGGKLKVGGDVLVGLRRWETLVEKTPEVDRLLENMADELQAALGASARLVSLEELPGTLSASQVFNALGFQGKGLEFVTKTQPKEEDLTPLLVAPHVLHSKPRSLAPGTRFELLAGPRRTEVEFRCLGKEQDGSILLSFLVSGSPIMVSLPDPELSLGPKAAAGPRKATPGNRMELACIVPGEVLSYSVSPGDVLKAGAPLCVLESMKMEMKISVPDDAAGLQVKSLPCRARSKERQGDILAPGDLLLELQEASEQ
jgi:hypothetical protein